MLLSRGTNVREVSESLGHSDVAFTLRIYGHCMPDFRDRAANEMAAAFADARKAQREKEEKEKQQNRKNDASVACETAGAATGAATPDAALIPQTIN